MADELARNLINHDAHLLLDHPLLRLPQELLRRNLKTVQRQVERENKEISSSLHLLTTNSTDAAQSLDKMISRVRTAKRKLEILRDEERVLHEASRSRMQHLQQLHEMESLADVKYDRWSRIRLDRLLVEYLARQGYEQSAQGLAQARSILPLVDLDVFAKCESIRRNLKHQRLDDCLTWCLEQKAINRKMDNRLEFELRLQQYIELCRQRRLVEAQAFGRKTFPPFIDSQRAKILSASSLLVFAPDRPHQYSSWYSLRRYDELADLFTKTHHELLSLSPYPMLLIALAAGLPALKTPSCHSKHASSTANAGSTTTSVCPICSSELNEMARKLPYAHHTKSHVENDPIVLPNGRVYGRQRLVEYSKKLGLKHGQLKDPTTSETWTEADVRKVYIT